MPDILQQLARVEPVDGRVAIVVAHPDDEVLALGSRLSTFRELLIIHLTDGAPRRTADAGGERSDEVAAYAAARREELGAAHKAAGADGAELRCYDRPDQDAVLHCRETVARLTSDLLGAEAVFTHPYEHGHPDHDAAALTVSLACARLRAETGRAPIHLEFPSYHMLRGEPVFGVFWPDAAAPETVLPLDSAQRRRKRAALTCFVTQAHVIAHIPIEVERLRPAPRYDFRAPAPPGQSFYEALGWEMTCREWRRLASAVLGPRQAGAS